MMPDDLVTRLRDFPVRDCCSQRAEAADRIEQLEAALRKICDGPRDANKSYPELFAEVCWEARAALQAAADARGLSLSAYVRMVALEAAKKELRK